MRKIFVLCGILIGVILVTIFFLNNRINVINDRINQDHNIVSTKKSLPTIGSKEKLAGYFKQILENEAEYSHKFGVTEEKSLNVAAADSSGKQDVSETNIQVEGVDEADLVKTDGQYIYQIGQNKVDIIQASPVDGMSHTGRITFDNSFAPTQLFLYQNQLLVIGNSMNGSVQSSKKARAETVTDSMIAPAFQTTNAFLYNVENPQKPEQIREIKLDGSYVSSRRIDGIVYLVTNHFPSYWLLKENENVDIRPMVKDTVVSSKEHPIDYNEIQYFPDSSEANFTIIAALNLDKPAEGAAFTTYLGSGSQMYMSKKNLYFAVPKYQELPGVETNEMITPDSTIYKFVVSDTKVSFHSKAEIIGTILNQFSMDEHQGYFRLVTTKGNTWAENQPSTNGLYILDENLKQVGVISNLAQGERIYSARFLGDRIYMVTFKETDPLFVIDASHPTQPKVLGELKIPGFSNYLHPYDQNHIIGFGQETILVDDKATNGPPRVVTGGVKITLFDVSDMGNPKEKYTEVIGGRGTYSPLNYDHKALLFNKNKNLFAFPISVYRNKVGSEYEQIFEFQGAYLYDFDLEKGFTLKSKITHEMEKGQYENWENGIQRLVYIDDIIYALSPNKISAHDLSSNVQLAELSLQ